MKYIFFAALLFPFESFSNDARITIGRVIHRGTTPVCIPEFFSIEDCAIFINKLGNLSNYPVDIKDIAYRCKNEGQWQNFLNAIDPEKLKQLELSTDSKWSEFK